MKMNEWMGKRDYVEAVIKPYLMAFDTGIVEVEYVYIQRASAAISHEMILISWQGHREHLDIWGDDLQGISIDVARHILRKTGDIK